MGLRCTPKPQLASCTAHCKLTATVQTDRAERTEPSHTIVAARHLRFGYARSRQLHVLSYCASIAVCGKALLAPSATRAPPATQKNEAE